MEHLLKLRNNSGLKQSEIAKKLGISRQAYCHYETGKREASYETLCNMATFFDTSVDYLLGRTELKSSPIHWTDNDKAVGVGMHGTQLSDEEWELLELFSELKRVKGEATVRAIITMIKNLLEES